MAVGQHRVGQLVHRRCRRGCNDQQAEPAGIRRRQPSGRCLRANPVAGVEKSTVHQTFTDQATGLSVTDIQPNTINKDLSVVDNGDGTLTAIVLLTGGERTYGHAGKLIASNSGQIRLRIVYDYVNDV